ncbi:MAG: DUF3301 domain-containing protein [Xanthomonadales bacterium]|nr:DUF3301 domain-containing protein [Xanthomonadales bacterium]
MTGLLILVLFGVAAISWWRLSKGKETARHAASAACKDHGLLLMDDTVMLEAVKFKRDAPVRAWGLKYRFEFVKDGILRKGGTVLVLPGRYPTVIIETTSGRLIQEA